MPRLKIAQYAIYFFYANAIVNLFSQVIKVQVLEFVTKPLIMLSLLVYYLTGKSEKSNLLTYLMIGAIIFSWLGDVILMLQAYNEVLFLFGLGSFLIAHLFYIFVYRKTVGDQDSAESKSFIRTRIVFLIFVGLALLYMLFPTLEDMLFPVAIYTMVIITMAIAAVMRKGRTTDKSFIMVYSGALLFVMSDAMIAIDKFLNPLVQARLLIMATYIAAQLLIVKGILLHENSTEQSE